MNLNTVTRTGKIARLPLSIRDQLNRRLLDNEPGPSLLAWLNSLPEVQALLAADFASQPISPANLSHWKGGAYRDWPRPNPPPAASNSLLRCSFQPI